MSNKESWGSRIGLILAMAGNAVGLGNFLRFPVKAIQNGGGAFIIPYLVCFLLMGLPLLYVEWAMGRFGGSKGNHSTPFILDSFDKRKFWKYLGVFGIFTNIAVAAYYCYLESWTLNYVWRSISGSFSGGTQESIGQIFDSYTSLNSYEPIVFWLICILLNTWILSKGLSGGIEKVAKIGMPLLILFGIFLAVKGITLKAGDHNAINDGTVGLNYLWTPDFKSIWDAKVWLAAAGQVFFTLSLGMGSIHCYASYIKKSDDIALNSQAAGWTNEFVEIILGSAILIPISIGYLGIDVVVEMTKSGGFGLGFKTLPYLFQQWGSVMAAVAGVMWFGLLFFAGITSSLAMGTPWIGFLEDEFNWKRSNAAWTFGLIIFIIGLPTVLFYNQGVFDEFDYWAGEVSLVVFALIEIVLFAWIYGMDKGWREITDGADIRVPMIYKFVIKWITPFILTFVFFGSLSNIKDTIMHTADKNTIAEMNNPNLIRDNMNGLKEGVLIGLNDSIILETKDLMSSPYFSKDQKKGMFDYRAMNNTYSKYISAEFNKEKDIKNLETRMFYKNISRPFLLGIFLFICYLVYRASLKREKSN